MAERPKSRVKEALAFLEKEPLARRARPEERPPKGQVEVTFVGKLLGRKAK
jgi:hypothetical protein